jgi:hypothetical protein
MDRNRILELAIEQLQQKKAGIDTELEMIQTELNGAGAVLRQRRLPALERLCRSS